MGKMCQPFEGWMKVDIQNSDDDDSRESDVQHYPSSDEEENTDQTFLPQEDVVVEDKDNNNNHQDFNKKQINDGVNIVSDPKFNAGDAFDNDEDYLQQDKDKDILFDEHIWHQHSKVHHMKFYILFLMVLLVHYGMLKIMYWISSIKVLTKWQELCL